LEKKARVAGKKQSKQAQNSGGRPNSLVSLPDLLASLPCQPDFFVLCLLLALVLQSGFFGGH
jgi:hypothetical protein